MSSTFSDLIAERQAVEAVINRMALTYVGMEHFGSFSNEPLNECLAKVRDCEVMVLVLAEYYGSKPRNESISFTEAEYREAERQAKSILAYFAAGRPTDDGGPETAELARFKSEVARTRGVSFGLVAVK
jgi:hypothetical protein